MLPPILICRTEHERCLIEASINSLRISVKIKQSDALEEILTKKFMSFLTQRAENFWIIRRVPVEGYDISLVMQAPPSPFPFGSSHVDLGGWMVSRQNARH